MSRAKNLLRPYSVEIAPAAWTQVAHLPREAYLTLQERLRAVAEQAGAGRLFTGQPAASSAATASSFTFGDYMARFEVDEVREQVRLLAVGRALRDVAPPAASMQRSPSSSE